MFLYCCHLDGCSSTIVVVGMHLISFTLLLHSQCYMYKFLEKNTIKFNSQTWCFLWRYDAVHAHCPSPALWSYMLMLLLFSFSSPSVFLCLLFFLPCSFLLFFLFFPFTPVSRHIFHGVYHLHGRTIKTIYYMYLTVTPSSITWSHWVNITTRTHQTCKW